MRCKPNEGWSDYSKCTSDSHCESDSCAQTHGSNRNCKPKAGFKRGYECSGSWQCAGTMHCTGAYSTCQSKKSNGQICSSGGQCKSGSCVTTFGSNMRCKPNEGWSDYSKCTSNSHCKSRSCAWTVGTDRKCKPKAGFGYNRACRENWQCAGTMKCRGYRCKRINLYNKVKGGCHTCVCGFGCLEECKCKRVCPFKFGKVLSSYNSKYCWHWA